MRPARPTLLLLLAACELPAPTPRVEPGPAPIVRRLAAMGTGLTLEVEATDRPTALRASEAAVRAIEAAETRLSTWRDDSELAALNRAPAGKALDVSPALAAELGAARDLWEATGGAFDPGVGPLVAAWDLRGAGRVPSQDERARALAASGLRHLRLEGSRATRLHPDLVLEEGAFGKGAGLDLAIAALRAGGATRAIVDLGGQLAFLGPGPFEARVADPRRREREVLALALDGGSVATSGNSERGREVGGARIGHLLDPRTGAPAPDFGSVTVWAPDGLAADALATGLFVLGPDAALAWAASHAPLPGLDGGHRRVEVLVLEPLAGGALRARASAGLAGRLRPLQDDVVVDVASLPPPNPRTNP